MTRRAEGEEGKLRLNCVFSCRTIYIISIRIRFVARVAERANCAKIELFRRSNRFIFIDAREFNVKMSALTRKIDNFGSSHTEQQQRENREFGLTEKNERDTKDM